VYIIFYTAAIILKSTHAHSKIIERGVSDVRDDVSTMDLKNSEKDTLN